MGDDIAGVEHDIAGWLIILAQAQEEHDVTSETEARGELDRLLRLPVSP